MTRENEILLNKWGQSLIEIKDIITIFSEFSLKDKKKYLIDLAYLIIQSKPKNDDIQSSVDMVNLKLSYTSCVLLKKNGFKISSFEKIIELPENEINKTVQLFLGLFKLAYKRRFIEERNNADKWWYQDLSKDTMS